MNAVNMHERIVRYSELIPCKTAFIDAHTPGSDQKENFTIIGAGVSESLDQHVHINETPGFNIGAAGQPPNCRNSLHTHTTAEVFFVLSGRWRFFWGNTGDAGEVVLEEGDLIDLPTDMFRGFENIGSSYGMIMSVLGGDDAGGGVVWAPQVIEEAGKHGLVLGNNGVLYDTKRNESLPQGVSPMPTLTPQQMAQYQEPSASEVVPRFVARYKDMMQLASNNPASVLAAEGMIKDKPGFEIELLKRDSIANSRNTPSRHEVLMVMRGHWRLDWGDEQTVLSRGDVCAIPPGLEHSLAVSMDGEASMFRVRGNDDPAGATYWA